MTTTTQQTPPTPAQRLAAKIRARTNDTRDVIDLLHDIAQGEHDATEHDQLTATGILFDRGYGKCPKQAPVLSHVEACPEQSRRGPASADPNPVPETDNNDVEAIRESSPAVPHEEPTEEGRGACPERSRRVTQLDDSLHESLGPAPEPRPEPVEGAESAEARGGGEPALSEAEGPVLSVAEGSILSVVEGSILSVAEGSIQSIIRDHIIAITNDGDTLIDVLIDIAWPDDPNIETLPPQQSRQDAPGPRRRQRHYVCHDHRPVTSRAHPKCLPKP